MKKFSKNKKLNLFLFKIYDSIIYSLGNESKENAIEEIARYKKEFPNELDYNIAQYGNLLIYYYQIRELLELCGYSPSIYKKLSDSKIWEIYLRNVGYVVREILKGGE